MTIMDAMAECLAGMSHDDVSPTARRKIEASLTAALSASPAGVKPLEWRDNEARSPVGTYRVQRLDDKWEPLHNGQYMLPRLHGVVEAFDTPEAAKSAAFADYSARIMSAIEPAGVGVESANIDEAARHLRETLQRGKLLKPWPTTDKATKKKWILLAEGTIRAALKGDEQ